MKLAQSIVVMFATTFFSNNLLAGVFKCTDGQGNTSYQSAPCAKAHKALEIDINTGGSTDLTIQLKQKEADIALKKQQETEQKNKIALEAKRNNDATEQSAINQQLIKNNPIQYTAFAIPPYLADKLPPLVKEYETRLPDIEKFRRLAAQKALATGDCRRVESDVLSVKSTIDQLVFSVDCSSAKTFYFNETELSK